MQNIDVRFSATSNFTKVKTDLAALEAEAAALGKTLRSNALAKSPDIIAPQKWKVASRAVHEASATFRNAAASSGVFTTQQIRATSETEKFTKALQKQKLSLGDMRKNWGIMKEVYRDQLRFQRMAAVYHGTDVAGRGITDIVIPKNVPADLDTIRRKMGMFGNMAASAGTQVINLGKNIQWSGRQLTVGFTYPMAMFGAAAGMMAYKVEDAFGSINKVYDYSAKALKDQNQLIQEQGDLRAKSMVVATDVAKQYGLTISKTLEVEQALAATGLKGTNLFDTTKEVQRISAIGSIDPQQTTEMIISLKNAFKDEAGSAKGLTDTLNYMNAASNATSLSLQDIVTAVPRAAAAMSQMGVSAKDMTVLLVSMREAGVNAAEGANALKSASARILNTQITDKVTKMYKDMGADINVTKMATQSKGNFLEFIRLLGQAQKASAKLDSTERGRANASLFGTYQFSRLSAVLKNVNDAYDGVNNQTAKAMELSKASSEELAHQAAVSQKAMMSTPAAQLRKEFAKLQIQLAQVGDKFLSMAVDIVKAATGIVDFFNKMPGWAKHLAMLGAITVALAGPVVMLGGLFLNLAGQFIKGVGSIAKWIGISTLVTKQEKAEQLATEAASAAMAKQTEQTSLLSQELRVLTEALAAANETAIAYSEVGNSMFDGQITDAERAAKAVVDSEEMKQRAIQETFQQQVEQSRAMATYGQKMPVTAPVHQPLTVQPVGKTVTGFRGESMYIRDEEATARAQQLENERVAALNKENQLLAEQHNRQNGLLATQTKVKDKVTGTGIAMGVMGAAMAATLVSSNHVVDSIAKWAMVGTMAVPAFQLAAKGVNAITTGMSATIRATAAARAGMTALGGTMAVAKAGAVGFGVALNEALGPIGWIALGLTAVVGVFMAIRSHENKIKAEQEALINKQLAANKAIESSTRSIATNMGKAAGSYKQIISGSGSAGARGPESQMLQSYNYYKSSDGASETAALKDTKGNILSADALMDKVRTKFIDLQVLGKDTAKQAKADIAAMLMAAGESSSAAMDMAEQVYNEYGNINKIDWAGPIKDQSDQLDALARKAFTLRTTMMNGQILTDFTIDDGQKKLLYQQAGKAAQMFNQALASAATPNDARKIIKQYMDAATSQWQTGFDTLMATNNNVSGAAKLKELFAKYGVDSGKAFADAIRNNKDFAKAYNDMINSSSVNSNLSGAMKYAVNFAREYEHAFVNPVAKGSSKLADGIWTAVTAMKAFAGAGVGLSSDAAAKNLMATNAQYAQYAATRQRIEELERKGVPKNSKEMLILTNQLNSSSKGLTKTINTLNRAYGYAEGINAGQAMYNLLNHIAASGKHAADEVNGVGKNLDGLHDKTVNIRINQVGGIIQSAMSGVQEDMATSAMNKFNSGWDSRMAGLQASQEAASNRLENQQQNAQDAFDARWQHRKDVLDKAYQSRLDHIKREIDAEQKADDVRQRLFEKEKARLQQLADMANTNIDFNVQLNQGNLDEAAKTLNNAQVKSANDQMDAEQKAAEARSQARIAALEKKNDRLEKQKDKEMKQLEKMEARMRKHLERVQAARTKALQAQQEQETASMQKTRDYEEAMLEQRLTLFKAYTARNQADLERWMKKVGLTYDDFGSDVKAKGEKWSTYFQQSLSDHIRQAGTEVMNDNIWENVGKAMASKLLKGLGFNGLADFRNFVKTGTLGGIDSKGNKNADSGKTESRHTGGVVGSGLGSRGSIPNTYKGMHPTEKMIRAQKGEYVINRRASSQHKGLLDAINSGSYRGYDGIGGVTGDIGSYNPSYGYGNASGLLTGAMARMFFQGTGKAFKNVYQNSKKRNKSSGSHHDEYGGPSGGFVQGSGGRHRPISGPVTNWLHDQYTGYPAYDFAGPIGTPVYAVADGTISRSYDIRGYEPRREVYGTNAQDGYRSYGRVIYLRTDAGPEVLYAHLSKRSAVAGQRVKGGAKLGARGNTGHVVSSTGNGAHLHFGATNGPGAWLRQGGRIKYDNTPAVLHSGESVLTKRLTDKFEQNVSGGGDSHHVTLDLRGATIKEDVDIERAMETWWNKKGQKVGRKRVVN